MSEVRHPHATLVRRDWQYYIGAAGSALAHTNGNVDIILSCYVPCVLVCEAAWVVLDRPAEFYKFLDATLWQYLGSLSIWVSLAIMAWVTTLQGLEYAGNAELLAALMDGKGMSRHAETAVFVAMGVGAQPILANFTSGFLLVLFRPFRVGDFVKVGGDSFTVRAITAFFVNGVAEDNRFVSLPNSAIIAGNLISNCTANSTEFLYIKVWVHAGQQSCSSVSELDVKPAKQTDQPASQPARPISPLS